MQRAGFKLLERHLDNAAGWVTDKLREHARGRQEGALGIEKGLRGQGALGFVIGLVLGGEVVGDSRLDEAAQLKELQVCVGQR